MTIKPIKPSGQQQPPEGQTETQSQTLATQTVRQSHRNIQRTNLQEGQSQPHESRVQVRTHTTYEDSVAGHRKSPHKRGKRDHHKREPRVPAEPIACAAKPNASPNPHQTGAAITPGKPVEESASGYNSGDEHGEQENRLTEDQWKQRDEAFVKAMSGRGLSVQETVEDGACLFRAFSLQIFGDQDLHDSMRNQTMNYIGQNREYFAQYVTEDFNSYVSRKRNSHVHGNHIEIQAMSEMYNRAVEVYCYNTDPINIFNSDQINNGYEPVRLSYQRGTHYNAIIDPYKASVGVGLGLAGHKPGEIDKRQMCDAMRLSEELEIEQTMLQDKLKTTDWEATNEAIEEQIARESYLQWRRDTMNSYQKTMTSSSATVTSSSTSTESANAGGSSSNQTMSTAVSNELSKLPNSSSDENLDDSGASSSSTMQPGCSSFAAYYMVSHGRKRHRKKSPPQSPGGGSSTSDSFDSDSSFLHKAAKQTRSNTNTSTEETAVTDPIEGTSSKAEANSVSEIGSKAENAKNDGAGISGSSSQIEFNSPGTSKSPSKNDCTTSEFYHSLLESSYANDGECFAQLSEQEMLHKALHMSRVDFIQHRQWDPPSP